MFDEPLIDGGKVTTKGIVLAVIVCVIVAVGALIGVNHYMPRPTVEGPTVVAKPLDRDAVITVGQFSYIPLNLDGGPGENASAILTALQRFSEQVADIRSYQVEYYINGFSPGGGGAGCTYGIWVFHEPKPKGE